MDIQNDVFIRFDVFLMYCSLRPDVVLMGHLNCNSRVSSATFVKAENDFGF